MLWKTICKLFFSSNNIFFLSVSSLLAYTHSHCAFLHPPAYSNCTCISTHNSFCGRWNCQKSFLILFMSVIPQNSVPSFPKMYSKKLLQVQSPALNTLQLQKLCFWSENLQFYVVINTEAQGESVVWGIAVSQSVCQSSFQSLPLWSECLKYKHPQQETIHSSLIFPGSLLPPSSGVEQCTFGLSCHTAGYFKPALTLLRLYGASPPWGVQAWVFHVSSVVVTKRNKTLLERLQGQPWPSCPREGSRSCAISLHQLCSFDLIFSRPLMGASEIPPFLLFCLCCQSCSEFLPSSVLSPLGMLFLAFTCAKKCLLLKPLRLSLFLQAHTSFDVQENMKVRVHLLPSVAQYGK